MLDPGTVELLARGGSFVLLAWVVVALWKEWLIPGTRYQRLEAEKEDWKRLALELLTTTSEAVTVAKKVGS